MACRLAVQQLVHAAILHPEAVSLRDGMLARPGSSRAAKLEPTCCPATFIGPRASLQQLCPLTPHPRLDLPAVLDTLMHGVLPAPVPPMALQRPELLQKVRELLHPEVRPPGKGAAGGCSDG